MEYQYHTEPFQHQKSTFLDSRDKPVFGILWEQGTGKTKLAIDTACYLWEKGEIDAVLVVAPNGVHRNWLTDELPTHMPTRIRSAVAARYWDTARSNNVGFKRELNGLVKHKGFAWLLMSFDGFMTKNGKNFVWRWLRNRRCLYILDEAHHIKTPSAKRTVSVVASGKYAPYRRILTGTPIATGPFDVYSQMKFLDDNFWKPYKLDNFRMFKFHFGEWFTRAEAQEAMGYDPGYDKLIGHKNLDQLQEIVAAHTSRVTKDQVLDLPPKLYSKRYYELTTEQQRLYKELKEQYIAELEDGAVVDGNLAIVRLLRLQQVICGYVQVDDPNEPLRLLDKNPRLTLLGEITESLTHPAIIWARFREDIDQIMTLLGDKAVRYDGAVTDDEAQEAKEAFQQGRAQFFVGNPQKGKEGLTLNQARTVIYYSNSFALIDRLQSEDRAHRIGQEHPVSYIDITAAGTVDEHIVKSMRKKFDIATKITGDQLREWI